MLAVAGMMFSCTQDNELNSTDTTSLDADVNLQTTIPNQVFDTSSEGRYAGVIVSNASDFHGKIWINVGDAALRQFAQVELINSHQRVDFDLTETLGENLYRFSNNMGSFDVNLADAANVTVENVMIQGNPGQVRLLKETSQSRMVIMLGTYNDQFLNGGNPDATGTWDIVLDSANPLVILEVLITTSTNTMLVDSGSFEVGNVGCLVNPSVPTLFDGLGPGTESDYYVYAINQTFNPFGGTGGTIIYDFGWDKRVHDGRTDPDTGELAIDYSGGTMFPEGTNPFIWGNIDPACYFTDVQGSYVWINNALDAFNGAGAISFDTSGFMPPPPSGSFGSEVDTQDYESISPVLNLEL